MHRVIKLLFSLGALAVIGLAQPTVSNARAENVSWSSAEILFDSTAYTAYRIRFIESPGTCTGGSGGSLMKNGTLQYMRYGQRAYLTGLKASTLYNVCPEAFSSSWSSGVSVPVTTTAHGSDAPIAPIEMSRTFPAIDGMDFTVAGDCSDFQTKIDAAVAERASSGENQRVIVPAGTVCTDEYDTPTDPAAHNFAAGDVTPSTARLAWTAHGLDEMDEIHFGVESLGVDCTPGTNIFPKGANIQIHCGLSGGWNFNKHFYAHVVDVDTIQVVDENGDPEYPGWVTFTNAAIDTGADTITLAPNEFTPAGYESVLGGGIAANTEIYLVPLNGATLPTASGGGLSATTRYFILVGGCASGTATCSFQISESSGGAAKNFTSTGSGTFLITTRGTGSNMWVAKAPAQADPWVLITSDGTLPAVGTRITSASDSQMFHIQRPASDRQNVSFRPGIMGHNIRFRGAIFDADTSADTDYSTMMEPRSFKIGPSTNQTHRYIVFDQCRFQGATTPHRTADTINNGLSMELNGAYIAMINSDMRDFDYPKSWRGSSTTGPGADDRGLDGSRVNNTVMRLSAGVAELINGVEVTLSSALDLTVSNGASVTGTGRVGIDLSGHIQYLLPVGVVATCNTAVFANCDVENDAGLTPAFPTSNSRRTWLGLASITFTSGNIASVTEEESVPGTAVAGISEGTNAIIAGKGPGPYLFYNNYISGAGLTTHFDEGGGQLSERGDYVLRGNTFATSARARFFQSGWDGLWYSIRQPLEWKAGQRALIIDNTFPNCFAQGHPQTFCVIITGYNNSATDFDFQNNNFYNTVGGIWFMATDRLYPSAHIARRLRITNNTFRINAWDNYSVGATFPKGYVFQTNAMEGLEISHNVVLNNRGDNSAFLKHNGGPVGGAVIRDNITSFNSEWPFILGEDASSECVGLVNKAFLNCEYVAGGTATNGANASYTWEHNVVVPTWTNTQAETGHVTAATVTTALTGLTSDCGGPCVPDEASVAVAFASIGFACVSLATCEATEGASMVLTVLSPYKAQGTAGSDIGIEGVEPPPEVPTRRRLYGGTQFRGGVR